MMDTAETAEFHSRVYLNTHFAVSHLSMSSNYNATNVPQSKQFTYFKIALKLTHPIKRRFSIIFQIHNLIHHINILLRCVKEVSKMIFEKQ